MATEKCPECGIRLCGDHKFMHGHIGSISIPDDRKESFSSLLSFYHTILKDKIRALRVLNDMSSNTIENYLASEKDIQWIVCVLHIYIYKGS